MKKLILGLFFSDTRPNRIWSGVSSSMRVNYTPADRTQHLLGLYEREMYAFLRDGISRGDTLIDIGANDGYYGLAFLKSRGKKVILCEPGEDRNRLVDNLKLNGCQVGVDYLLEKRFVTGHTTDNQVSINELIPAEGNVFILMDIEGGEGSVIDAFDPQLATRTSWLIETHALSLEENIVKRLTGLGYNITIIKQAWWRSIIPEKRVLPHNRWLFARMG